MTLKCDHFIIFHPFYIKKFIFNIFICIPLFPDWASFLLRFFQLKSQNVHRGRGDIDGGCHVRIKSEAYLGSFTPFSQFITGADAIKLYTDVGPGK